VGDQIEWTGGVPHRDHEARDSRASCDPLLRGRGDGPAGAAPAQGTPPAPPPGVRPRLVLGAPCRYPIGERRIAAPSRTSTSLRASSVQPQGPRSRAVIVRPILPSWLICVALAVPARGEELHR
jgi:hypothetical protein